MRLKKFLSVLLLLFLLCGCKRSPDLRCTLTFEGKVLLEKECYSSLLFPFGKNRIAGGFEKSGMEAIEYLRTLNPSLAEEIERCCENLSSPKSEPEIIYMGEGEFSFKEGKPGRVASANEVATLLLKNNGAFIGEIPCRDLLPVLGKEDLLCHAQTIATFSSDYSSSSEERKHNIALAVKKLDNLTVEGGATLSFNGQVGKRTKENGFEEAGVILYGQFTRGVGGGVCQVSTTLYNAWNLAGLSSQGQNHSLAVSYVPAGLDAMVSETTDLLLTNSGDYPVYLDADCNGNTVTFTVYGTPIKEKVTLWSQKVATLPCNEYEVAAGDEEKILSFPKDGAIYRSYRDFYRGDRLVKRETLRTSSYKKVKGKKIVPVPSLEE